MYMKYRTKDLAYIAGLFDGDGTVSIVHQKVGGKLFHTPYVNIVNTNKKVIDWIYNTLQFGNVRLKNNGKISSLKRRKHY